MIIWGDSGNWGYFIRFVMSFLVVIISNVNFRLL